MKRNHRTIIWFCWAISLNKWITGQEGILKLWQWEQMDTVLAASPPCQHEWNSIYWVSILHNWQKPSDENMMMRRRCTSGTCITASHQYTLTYEYAGCPLEFGHIIKAIRLHCALNDCHVGTIYCYFLFLVSASLANSSEPWRLGLINQRK